jgi:hypothetical protein
MTQWIDTYVINGTALTRANHDWFALLALGFALGILAVSLALRYARYLDQQCEREDQRWRKGGRDSRA